MVYGKLTVFFDEPFWVGVFERIDNKKLSVCKVTFGAEPKDCEVFQFIMKNYSKLKFSPSIKTAVKTETENPKRIQREIKKQISQKGIGTKSQQALKQQFEENKLEHKAISKEQRDAEAKRKFELKTQKRKEKHRGR